MVTTLAKLPIKTASSVPSSAACVVGKAASLQQQKPSGGSKEYIGKLETAILDLLDGQNLPYQIMAATGLNIVRCLELSALYDTLALIHGEPTMK